MIKMFIESIPKADDNWIAAIKQEASKHFISPSLSKSIELYMIFNMPRPKHHFKKMKDTDNKPIIRDRFLNEQHKVKPSILKLIMSVMDALTGIVYMDDANVIYIEAEKQYVDETTSMKPGLSLEISV